MSIDSIACDLYVDISGTDCAVPFSKLNDALDALLPGKTLLAVSRKQALQSDIPAFCRQKICNCWIRVRMAMSFIS